MTTLRHTFAVLLACSLVREASAQGATDRLRGRVQNDSAQPIAGAAVFVTRGPDRAVKETATDSAGRWAVAFENGTGDYLVAVRVLGYLNVRRRVQADQPEQHAFVADFTLARDQSMLAAVKVVADKPQRASDRTGPFQLETGASEKWAEGVNGQVAPGTQGDLNAPNGLS